MEGTRQTVNAMRPGHAVPHVLGLPQPAGFPAQPRAARRPRPIDILHVHGRMARGGAEVRTVEILRHVDRRRYRFHFCAVAGVPGELDHEIRRLGGQVHLLRQSRFGFPRRFRRLLRQERIDVVHSHLHYYSGYLLRLAAECRVPVRVAHFRSSKSDVVPGPVRRVLHGALRLCVERYASDAIMRRWLERYATSVLGVSRSVLVNNWGTDWQSDPRCQVVYDGIDTAPYSQGADSLEVRREFQLPQTAPLFVHVGRMVEPKNHGRLVSIFAEVLQRRPTARLLLVGRMSSGRNDNTIEQYVRRRIAELGMARAVVFAGERTDVPRLLKAADALIFPSLWEGLGDVVLEALAAGTPVLASDLPSIREMAARLSGIHCLSLDEPDVSWARLAEELAAHRPSEQQRQAALASFLGSEFTVQRCTETLCRIWQCAPAERTEGGDGDG
ncbi:MAG: glycosyltransferase [Pirellulales bacterium]|nr:glycosyltransferase [Pirellulales bacterium]